MTQVKQIYDKLMQAYGPQGWWPLTSKAGKKGFNDRGYRITHSFPKTDEERWEIILGAILTQNTSWKNAEKSLAVLKETEVMHSLGRMPEAEVAKLIRSSGYFNQKAKKIKAMLLFLDSGAEITRENLLDVWGVGEETADSILLYAFGKPYFVVDLYTKRIFSRIGLIDGDDYSDYQEFFHNNLDMDSRLFNEYHALIVEHAKRHCRKKPECKKCSLLSICSFRGKHL